MKTITVNSPTEFLDHLKLTHPTWGLSASADYPDWISREIWAFRGQERADWSLMPSAFRPGTRLGFAPQAQAPAQNPRDRKEQERKILNQFLFHADRVGLDVPGDGQHFRLPQLPGHPEKQDLDAWPWEKILETLAVAQHHGVPTRLLDFSYSPTVAGFFATYDAWTGLGRPNVNGRYVKDESLLGTKLAVWGVHLPVLYEAVGRRSREKSDPRIILISAPRAKNTYLHNQEGIFLLDLECDQRGYPSMEIAIEDVHQEVLQQGAGQFAAPQVVKIEMEWRHAPETLSLLWNEFYHVARLQPTFDKVVQALNDHYDLFRA